MAGPLETTPSHRLRTQRTAAACIAAVAAMIGLAYASVPLYQMFCQATGFQGTTLRASKAATVVIDRRVTVRFDANVAGGLPWTVEPLERTVDVRLGETHVAVYRATNTSDRTVTGTAAFNVAPEITGQYFNKLECFCFTEQTLKPGESADLPVSFFVDPAAAEHRGRISQITLSYSFYPVDKPASAGIAGAAGGSGRRG